MVPGGSGPVHHLPGSLRRWCRQNKALVRQRFTDEDTLQVQTAEEKAQQCVSTATARGYTTKLLEWLEAALKNVLDTVLKCG